MDYDTALMAAGCTILEYESFGSYQGDWWAIVTHDGKTKLINGSFGSCSGCDSFQSEFDYISHYHYVDGEEQYFYDFNPKSVDITCSTCLDIANRLVAFGKRYVDDAMTPAEAVKYIIRHMEWDQEAREMMLWLKKKGDEYHINFIWPDTVLCKNCGKYAALPGKEECSSCDEGW